MNVISFQNKEFEVREIEIAGIGTVLISTDSLNKLLFNANGNYVSEEAITVDESIFYFVEDDEIKLFDAELQDLITKQLK